MSRNLGSIVLMYQYLRGPTRNIGVIFVRGLTIGARVAHAVIVIGGKLSFQWKFIFITFSLPQLVVLCEFQI